MRPGAPGAVLRKGDPDAGGVLVVLRGREGLLVLSQVRAGEGEPAWMRATGPAPVEPGGRRHLPRPADGRDPDLWIMEFESPDLTPPFPARLL